MLRLSIEGGFFRDTNLLLFPISRSALIFINRKALFPASLIVKVYENRGFPVLRYCYIHATEHTSGCTHLTLDVLQNEFYSLCVLMNFGKAFPKLYRFDALPHGPGTLGARAKARSWSGASKQRSVPTITCEV